jgi:hypothetical protein
VRLCSRMHGTVILRLFRDYATGCTVRLFCDYAETMQPGARYGYSATMQRLCNRMHGTVSPEIHFSCGRTKKPTCMKNAYCKTILCVENFELSLLIAKSALATINFEIVKYV